MKLIFCPHCQDVVKLRKHTTECECGRSGGMYLDSLRAVYSGAAIPLGFDNKSLASALKNQPGDGAGEPFTAFIIPKECPTFKQVHRSRRFGSIELAPDEEVTFGGQIRKTSMKRGPHQGIQPKK